MSTTEAKINIRMSGAAFADHCHDCHGGGQSVTNEGLPCSTCEGSGEAKGWTPDGLREVARILRGIADRIDKDDVTETLIDSHGNTCGSFVIDVED